MDDVIDGTQKESALRNGVRFFDGWVLVGILPIEASIRGPAMNHKGPPTGEASPRCPTRRGGAFSLPAHNE